MPLLGFDALGRVAPGQISNAAATQANITQAAGVGVAGTLRGAVAETLVGVTGIGVAGSLSGPNVVPQAPFSGYDGLVSARYTPGQISTQHITDGGVSISVVVPQAVGVGLAGSFAISTSTGLVGVAGGGVAGTITGNPTGILIGASGVGIAGRITVMVSGGGTSLPRVEINRRKKQRTGLEPVKKLPPRAVAVTEQRIPLPPPSFVRAPSLVPVDGQPPDLVDQALVPADLLGLQEQIRAAEDATDIQDILDMLALLD